MGAIYCITSTVTGKHYVGKTTQKYPAKRWTSHKHRARKGEQTHFYNAIRKYGEESWTFKVLVHNVPEQLLSTLEVEFIRTYNSLQDGYNSTVGGEGTTGYKLSEAHIAKLKEVHTGNTYGKGWHPSEEQRQKMSLSHKGKVVTQKTRQLLSEGRQGHKHHNAKPVNIYSYLTKELIATNVVIGEWCRANPVYNRSALSRTAAGKAVQYKDIYAVYTLSYEDNN